MAGDQAGVRRLLPQNSQMQSFSFVPNNFGNREPQKSMFECAAEWHSMEMLIVMIRLRFRG